MNKLVFLCIAAFSLVSATARAAHPFTVDDLLAARRIRDWAPSPDGKFVVYELSTPLPDENRATSAIWLQPLDGTPARQLTAGKKHDTAPAVVGNSVAFLSDRDGEPQLYLLDLRGGEPRQVTHLPGGVDEFLAARDGSFFIVASRVFPDCPPNDEACHKARLDKQAAKKSTGRVVERLLFRHWDTWADGQRSHLFAVEAASGHARDLTPGNFDAPPFSLGDGRGFDLSPDGKWLAFASNHDADESGSTNGDIWEVALAGGKARLLTADNRAFDGVPRYSPDGKSLAWRAQRVPAYESDRFELRVLDRQQGRVRNISESYDGWVGAYDWAPDSASLWFSSDTAGYVPLYRLPAAGGAATVVLPKIAVSDLRVLADGSVIFSRTSLSRPTELWRLPAGATTPSVITHVNDALFANITMGAVQERWVDAADGKKLHALMVTPPDFKPNAGKKYPALFVVHGGPEGAWGDDWSYRWNPQAFAAAGYVVYLPNPRGSTGYGQEFTRGILHDWGGKVFDDLMRQADDLSSLPFVDKKRIGAAGASFGGFMMNWFQGHTKRFAAILCHDGIADQETMYATEELWFPETEFGGFPWTSGEYRKWSPIESANQFATPELIVHGERDYRIPVEQAYLMFTTLKRRGVPTRLLVFPDENHWVLKPGNARLWYAEFFDWFHTYLGGAPADPKALDTAYSVTK